MPSRTHKLIEISSAAVVRLGLVLCLSCLPLVSKARAGVACGFTQLTDALPGGQSLQLVGLSGDGQEAILLSPQEAVGVGGGPGLELLRVATDGRFPSFQTVVPLEIDDLPQDSFSASDNLRRVLFRSDQNPTGENPDGSVELFLLNTETGRTFQLTDGSERETVFSAQISGDGSAVVYVSDGDPLGLNPDGSREVFWRSLAPARLLQLTQLSAVSVPHGLSLSENGDRVLIQVRQTLIGLTELQLIDTRSNQSQLVLAAARIQSFLDRSGSRILLATDADLVESNRDGSLEIYEINLETEPGNRLRQVTNFAAQDQPVFEPLGFSGNGQVVAIRSALDLQGWPAGGAANLFLLDVRDGSISQVTHWTAPQHDESRVQLNLTGEYLLMATRNNPLSAGTRWDGVQALLVGCEPAAVRYISQVGNGFAGLLKFTTSFIISNTGRNGSVRLDFFDPAGRPLEVPLVEQGTQSSFFFPVKSGTPLILSSNGQGPIQTGYARIISGPGITGNAVFTGARRPATVLYEAAVPLSEPMTDFSVVVNTRDSFLTGLALVNPASAFVAGDEGVASVMLRLYDENFDLLIEKPLELALGQHQAQFIDSIFQEVVGIDNFVGTLTVSSDRPLAAIALRQHDDPRIDFPFEVPTLTTLTVAPGRADQ